MKLKTALAAGAASVALVASSGAIAGDYYVGVFGGVATFEDELNLSLSGTYSKSTFHSSPYSHTHFFTANYSAEPVGDFENGWVVGAAIGTNLTPQLRGELEIAFRTFDVDEGDNAHVDALLNTSKVKYGSVKYSRTSALTGDAAVDSSGDVSSWSFMANLWYDFNTGNQGPLRPFVGAGIGLAQVSLEYELLMCDPLHSTFSETFTVTMSASIDEDDLAFAYQFGGGLAYDLESGISVSAQYRYFGTSGAEFGDVDLDVQSHNFMVGLSFPLR